VAAGRTAHTKNTTKHHDSPMRQATTQTGEAIREATPAAKPWPKPTVKRTRPVLESAIQQIGSQLIRQVFDHDHTDPLDLNDFFVREHTYCCNVFKL
jgi:hypothetical protein